MASMTYKNGSIELDPEMVNLIRNKESSDKVIQLMDRLVSLEKSKTEVKIEGIKDSTNSLNKVVDAISKGLDLFFDSPINNVGSSVEFDDRTDEEVEADVNKNYVWFKDEEVKENENN